MLAAHHTRVTQGFPSTQRQTAAPDWVLATAAIYFLPFQDSETQLSAVQGRNCLLQPSGEAGSMRGVPSAAASPGAFSCLGLSSDCGSPLA